MSKHLPLFFNPLLNVIFNNPHHTKSPFKSTIQELATDHNDFTILVPPSYILNDAYDPITTNTTRMFLKDMCYNNEEFIRSHIIRSNHPVLSPTGKNNQSIVYNTLSGKQILIKNGMVFTGKGFRKSLRLTILGFGSFNSFCDYFPKGSKFMIIYIEDSLIGSNFCNIIDYPSISPIKPAPIMESKENKKEITFEMLLRNFPLLSKIVSEKYYKLFHHNNPDYHDLRTQTRKSLSFIKDEFHRMVEQAYNIMQESVKLDNPDSEKTFQLIQNLLSTNPEIDLNKLVYEYVEVHLYDKIWSQLIYQFNYDNKDKVEFDKDAIKVLTSNKYAQMSCVSLNQLDIPVDTPWHINSILKRVASAIEEFTKLNDSSIINQSSKRQILLKTIDILTASDTTELDDDEKSQELVIDADTLVGMLIMVIIHSKVDNLEAHLYYIKNFQAVDELDGYFSYILSNLDAVIYHLSSSGDYASLVKSSQENYEFWSCIQRQDESKLQDILHNVSQDYRDELPPKHFIKSRNINGESCLMFAIKSKNIKIFEMLVDTNPQWFSVEDLLFDKNTNTGQNLLMVSLVEEASLISHKLVGIILSDMEYKEQIAYFNSTDNLGKSIGHYLFHDISIMEKIGKFINWELKDCNSHTPLFSICRCYDHSNYISVITTGFKLYFQITKPIDLDKHIDSNGNTLLHVILKGLKESNLLTYLTDVNQFNNKNMSPLTIYVKYNRSSNLETLLTCDRLNFYNEEPKNFYNVFDYLSFSASKPSKGGEFHKIENLIYSYAFSHYYPSDVNFKILATNSRYDGNVKEWVIFFRVIDDDGKQHTIFESVSKLKSMLQIFELKHPFLGLPSKEEIFINFDKQSVPSYSKYRINRFIENINQYLVSLALYSTTEMISLYELFTQREKQTSTFDLMKQVNKEIPKQITLTPSQINEIEIFLNYSLNDLEIYNKSLIKLHKLLIVYDIKLGDAQIVNDRLLSKLYASEFCKGEITCSGEETTSTSYSKLSNSILFLQFSNVQLSKKIREILTKLHNWKLVYDKIKNINHELRKFEDKINDHDNHDNTMEDNTANGNEIHSTDSNQDLLTQVVPESPVESSSFFNFGIENKKSRYKRLLLLKNDEIKTIISLNLDIKLDHESMALQISNYLRFKYEFIQFSLQQFKSATLLDLKSTFTRLQKNRGDRNFQNAH